MVQAARVQLSCAQCGAPFVVLASRLLLPEGRRPRFCGKPCVFAFRRGKTKETDSGVAKCAASLKAFFATHPEAIPRGAAHPKHGYVPSEQTRAKLRAAQARRVTTPAMLAALAAGRSLALTPEALARRGRSHSLHTKGRKNPEHSERMKRFYAAHPEKNPMIVLARKGHETDLERTLRVAMTDAGLAFERQYPIDRFVADFAFPAQGLVVEVDGTFWHDAEKDARRDGVLAGLGWRVLRFDERQVMKETAACVEVVRGALTLPHEQPLSPHQPRSALRSVLYRQPRLL